ncbi:MAG: hypothetical protein ACLTXH_10160 [Enterobacter hormaechei]
MEFMGSADPSLSTFTDPSGTLAGVLLLGDCRSAATFTDLLATAAPATRTGCSIVSQRNRRLQDRTL